MVAAALALPGAAFADTGQVVALYQQLIVLLQQEIELLKKQALTISRTTGEAPFMTTFMVQDLQGNEAIDFGDGRSTGSAGCPRNAKGFCDLSKIVEHTYQLPGSYTVSLLRTIDGKAHVVATYPISVE